MSNDQVQLVLEHFDHKFDSLIEAFHVMSSQMGLMARDSDVQEIKADVKTIKIAVADTNRDLSRLSKRVARLEKAVYGA